MRVFIAIIIAAFLSFEVYADTMLVGRYYDDDPDCFIVGDSLNRYKIAFYTATATGTATKLKIDIPALNNVGGANSAAGCTDDDVMFIVYDSNGSNPTQIKFYGLVEGYDWTTLGVGAEHEFDVTNIVTNATITQGQEYGIVIYSYALHQDDYSYAGCNQQIHIYRGRDQAGCNPNYKRFCSDGTCDSEQCYDDPGEITSGPPPASCFENNDIASYYDLSIWADNISMPDTTLAHGDTGVVINGTGFGDKDPARPLIWDDGEGATTNSDTAVVGTGTSAERNDGGTGWDEALPSLAGAAVTSHRTRYQSIPYEGQAGPHSNSQTYLVGGHYQYENNSPAYIGGPGCENEAQYLNVALTVDNGSYSDHWYAHFYYRLNDDWNTSIGGHNNHKVTVVQSGGAAYTPGGGFQYNVYEANNAPALESGHTCTIENGSTTFNNPRLKWVKWEEIIDNNGDRTVKVDNKDDDQNSTISLSGIRSFTFGGYYRFVTPGGSLSNNCDYRGSVYSTNKNFRYFDDLYADTTWARVMICDSTTYPTSDSYICEPQIPTAWSTTSIEFTVNQGALSDGTAYLFVFDSDNNANNEGFAVTLSSDTTPPTIQGITITGIQQGASP